MEREKFLEAFNKASDELDENKIEKVIRRVIKSQTKNWKINERFFIICMEELAELAQEISKSARGKFDRADLLQEIADVIIVLNELEEVYSINMPEIYKAVNVKVDRIENVLNEKGVYL